MQVITSLFLTAFLGASQANPAPTGTAEEEKNFRLEGMVMSAMGESLAGAHLRLQPVSARGGLNTYNQYSDAEGRYAFEDIAPGRYNIFGDKPGFLSQRYGPELNIGEGQRLTMVDIRMTPQALITGRISDQGGNPVVDSQVVVFRSTYIQGRKQLQLMTITESNDKGEYRVPSLPAGRYIVSANGRQGSNGSGPSLTQGNTATFYPNSIDQTSATLLDVAAGDELRGIDISMRRSNLYSLRGKAVNPAGPVPIGTILVLLPKDSADTTPYRIGLRPDGAFEYLNVSPGTYVLQVARNNFPIVDGHLEVNVTNSNLENLTVQLVPGIDLTGTVRIEGGDLTAILKPQAAPAVPSPLAIPPRASLSFMLTEVEGQTNFSRGLSVADDGTFQVHGIRAWKYSGSVFDLPEGLYMKSVRFGGQDITHQAIDLTNGVSGNLDIVLSTKAADLSGSVINDKGEPLGAVTVTLWPKTADPADPTAGAKITTTDQNGKFRFSNLAPGDYYTSAWEEIDSGLASYPEFLARFNGESSATTLTESGHANVNPKLIPIEKIHAEVGKLQ